MILFPALLVNYGQEKCLIIIGTEGFGRAGLGANHWRYGARTIWPPEAFAVGEPTNLTTLITDIQDSELPKTSSQRRSALIPGGLGMEHVRCSSSSDI